MSRIFFSSLIKVKVWGLHSDLFSRYVNLNYKYVVFPPFSENRTSMGSPFVSVRKANWIDQILRRNCLLQHVIEGKIKGQI